jgi:hypothetical protein
MPRSRENRLARSRSGMVGAWRVPARRPLCQSSGRPFLMAQTINLAMLCIVAAVSAAPVVVVLLIMQRSNIQGVRHSGVMA